MDNDNETRVLGSPPSGAEAQRVRVLCTRPRLPGEASHPHVNQIPEADILDRSKRNQFVCRVCGMPLILGETRRYVPLERLGSGGFGVTFKAIDLNLGTGSVSNRPKRVVKQLCPTHHLPPRVLENVQRLFAGEAAVLASLEHPRIPTLYDHFEEEAEDIRLSNPTIDPDEEQEPGQQKFFYLVQQYIQGIDLSRAIEQHGPFSEAEVKRFLEILLEILAYIHSDDRPSSRGSIIHRDIKPANIICSIQEIEEADGTRKTVADFSKGAFYLIDFGAVKEVVQAVERQLPSQTSAIVSMGFSPPEQIEGKPLGLFSDIYAVGATCVNLLTAKNPSHLGVPYDRRVWKSHAAVSSGFAVFLNKMLAVRSADRYQSAEEVLQALHALSTPTIEPAVVSPIEPSVELPTAPLMPDPIPQPDEQQTASQKPANAKLTLPRSKSQESELGGDRLQEPGQSANTRLADTTLEPQNPQPPGANRGRRGLKPLLWLGLLGLGLLASSVIVRAVMDRFWAGDGSAPVSLVPTSELISEGNQPIDDSIIALTDKYDTLKQKGIGEFDAGDYTAARETFASIRRLAKEEWNKFGDNLDTPYGKALQDPTVLIYQNNAEIRLRHAQGEPIYTVAAAVPLNLNIGREMLFGIAQAQDQAVNLPGGNRINLEIVIANDRNNPSQAGAIAKSLTEDRVDGRQILAVVGHYTSDTTCVALRDYYTPAGMPVISPLSTASNLRAACGGGNEFFRTTSSTKVEASSLVNYLAAQNPRPTVAVFYNSKDLFSSDLANQLRSFINDAGGRTVATFDLSNAIDVDAALNQVKDVDGIAVLPDGRTGTTAAFDRAVAIIKANRGQKLVLGSNPLYSRYAIENGGGLANLKGRLILATDWYRQCAPTGTGSFVSQAEGQDYWFGGVNRTTALSYEAVQALLATLTPNVTREQIQQKLENLGAEASVKSAIFSNKTISFAPNGDRVELTSRILTTPGENPNSPFDLVQGCAQ